jgi:predicted dehydrogenase
MNGYRSALEIVGTKSAAYLDCADQGFYQVDNDRTTGGDTHLWPEINGRIVGDLADEIAQFGGAVLYNKPFVQDWRESLDAVPVLDALARSSVTGLPVTVER